MESIGVRELRQHASRWLARVASGESFQITDRGRPVASLVPVSDDGWNRLTASGAVVPATSSLADVAPLPSDGTQSLSAQLADDRNDDR